MKIALSCHPISAANTSRNASFRAENATWRYIGTELRSSPAKALSSTSEKPVIPHPATNRAPKPSFPPRKLPRVRGDILASATYPRPNKADEIKDATIAAEIRSGASLWRGRV
jgi:hypothetical protein